MRFTFLGTGTSTGVPMIACECAVCTSAEPHNKRLRTSALLEVDGLHILFDAGPDLRQQMLTVGLRNLDAVLLTHAHADHVAGLDDLRPLNFAQKRSIPIYGTALTHEYVRERFSYAFATLNDGSSRPQLDLVAIHADQPFMVGAVRFHPLAVQHGTWPIIGYRVGTLGYVTDASYVPPETRAQLRGLDVLVLNALRYAPHPTHFSVAEALELIAELQPRRTLLVHMGHDLDHATTNAALPDGVQLAYDGQVIEIADPSASV